MGHWGWRWLSAGAALLAGAGVTLTVLQGTGHAEDGPGRIFAEWKGASPPNVIQDIKFPAGGPVGYAVGAQGTIMETADRGLSWQRQDSRTTANLIAVHFPADDQVGYAVGSQATLLKTFNEDLKLAGIDKKDAQGRTVDLHSLRHTYGTLLIRSGADIKTVQALMRHATPSMTLGIYVHADQGRMKEAVRMLPEPGVPPRSGQEGKAEDAKSDDAPGSAESEGHSHCRGHRFESCGAHHS